jgi:GntR family transcriptional regulator
VAALSVDDEVFVPKPDLTAASDLPAHTRIEHWLAALIESGQLHPGCQLPPELDMAGDLGISRMTLRQALSSLATRGLLEPRRGRYGGNFVTEPRFDYNLTGLPGFTEQMRTAHVEAGARVVHATTRTAPDDVRTGLRLKRGDQVHEVIRVRSANGLSIALEETYIPASLFPDLLSRNLTNSLYELMNRGYGLGPHSAEELVEPAIATEFQAELLDIEPGRPLLLVIRTSFTIDGTPVEFAHDYFRPDRTRLRLRSHVGG